MVAGKKSQARLMRERIGIFRGYGESRFDTVSEVLIPYREQRHMPLQGGYLAIAADSLDGSATAILGRVVRALPIGDLLGSAGEDYLVDLMKLDQEVPEAVRVSRLRYRVNLRLVGQVQETGDGRLRFSPSMRMTPHVGAPVGLPSDEVLRLIAAGNAGDTSDPGAQIGHLAVGSMAFDGSERIGGRCYPVHLHMSALVGRRTAVFARAGMGKSNFTKVLLSRLYEDGTQKVGTLIIDPEGEYAMANASEPGLLDLPALAGRVLLFTDRRDVDDRYKESIGGPCRIDFAELSPRDVVAGTLPKEKLETVFANSLRGLDRASWQRLLENLQKTRYRTSPVDVANIMGRRAPKGADADDVVSGAVINNLVPAIERLHLSGSPLKSRIIEHLTSGGIVILDVSMLSSSDAECLSGWILHTIFSNNQVHYTRAREADTPSRIIPTLAVLEEAQYYLGGRDQSEDSPFVRWFKEGRKYQLGSIVVTQQPGAIGSELISQCDNFFVFHLLSRIDLTTLEAANLHFTQDITTMIASEPIPGNCYFWSGRGMSMVTCARVLPFSSIVGSSASLPPVAPAKRSVSADKKRPSPEEVEEAAERILARALLKEHTVRLYPVKSRRLLWEGAKDADYPEAASLAAVLGYNLRFVVTDALEAAYPPDRYPPGTLDQMIEPLGSDRRIIREAVLQRMLRNGGWIPDRPFAKATHPKRGKEESFVILNRSKFPKPDRFIADQPLAIEVLP